MKWKELRTEIWAKSPRHGHLRGELLDEHTLEVVRRLAELRSRFPNLQQQAGDERLWHRLFWACFLHDFGKAAPPWQAYIHGNGPVWGPRHEVVSLAFLPWVAEPGSMDFQWMAAAVVSHHRDASFIDKRYDPACPDDMALDMMFADFDSEILGGLAEWLAGTPARWITHFGFEDSGVELPKSVPVRVEATSFIERYAPLGVTEALKGYTRLRRRLEDGSPSVNRAAILYRGLMLLADRLGSAHAGRMLEFIAPSGVELMAGRAMRDHQRTCAEARQSIILTAPTGSGKTEAALLWARRQQFEQDHRRTLFYLLPYQASINAMHKRLTDTLSTEVGLLHGRSTQSLYRQFLEEGYSSDEADKAARRAGDLARLQRPAVQVTTPYQLLRAAYRLRGFETIWTGLAGALLVLDEVHAYDPQRMGLLLGLLKRLVRDWDVRVCAVTATMPSWLRDVLRDAIQAELIAASGTDFEAFRRHELHLLEGSLGSFDVLRTVVERVERGEAVLVTANTVRSAQEAWVYLRDHLGKGRTELLHSRFTARDRLAREAKLLKVYGVDAGERLPGAVVSTQTIEVSLNLDFDTIVSEPAPLEALAQRFGRVNRKRRRLLAPVHVLTEPADGQGVYDRRLVERTLKVLRGYRGRSFDEAMLTTMLDVVYGDGLAGEFQGQVLENCETFERFCLDSLHAFDSDEMLEEQFDKLFDGIEVLPATLEAEFRANFTESPLRANALLVPLSYRQFAALRREGKVRQGLDRTWIVDVTYDPLLGLQLSVQLAETP